MTDKLLTIKQVQEILGVGRDFIYSRIKTGQLKSIKLGKYRRFRETDIIALYTPEDASKIDENLEVTNGGSQ
jgi:excisionase family DNA binding protein